MNIAERTDLRPLLVATEITQGICGLPAVATLDWCDRAAACLTRLCGPSNVVIMIANVSEAGAVSAVEAVGVAAGSGTGPRLAAAASPTAQASPGGVSAETLRSRADRLASLGWGLGSEYLSKATYTTASAASADWRTGPLGRLWGGSAAQDVLVGIVPLRGQGPDAGRVLIVQVAPATAGMSVLEDDRRVLEATMPLLAERVLKTLGPTRSSPRSWLTPREQQVLEQLSLGRSVKQIAEAIGRSPHTVHDHVKALHRKLSANSRGELIAKALGHIDAYSFDEAAPAKAEGSHAYNGNGATRQVG